VYSPFVPSECDVKMLAPRTSNINAQSCSNLRNSYPTVFKNLCLSTLHVLFVCGCGWASLPVCINNAGSAAFKHFGPLVHTSLRPTVFCPYLTANCRWVCAPFIISDTKNALLHVACPWCKSLTEQSTLRHAHSAQKDYNWTTLAACHCTTLSYGMTGLSSVANHTAKIF
jgi:hypothetical protein